MTPVTSDLLVRGGVLFNKQMLTGAEANRASGRDPGRSEPKASSYMAILSEALLCLALGTLGF